MAFSRIVFVSPLPELVAKRTGGVKSNESSPLTRACDICLPLICHSRVPPSRFISTKLFSSDDCDGLFSDFISNLFGSFIP